MAGRVAALPPKCRPIEQPSNRGRTGSIVGRAVMNGATIHIPDVLADPEYKMTEAAQPWGVHTMLVPPAG